MGRTFVGFGYDVHALAQGLPLYVGGVKIPDSDIGAVAHSDGDALLHAICDAILGASGLEDIGHFFPDTDPKWKGIDSQKLLESVRQLALDSGTQPLQVDSTVVLESPKLAPYRDQMRQRIAAILQIPLSCVMVKATTNEKMGPIGAGDGIAAFAVVTVERE